MDLIDQAAQPAPIDPWVGARREAAPNAIVFKHIDHINGKQCFVEIPRTEKNVVAGLDLYDGATVTYRATQLHCTENKITLADAPDTDPGLDLYAGAPT